MMRSLSIRIRHLLAAAKGLFGRRAGRLLQRTGRAGIGAVVSRIVSDAILFNETACGVDTAIRRVGFIAAKLAEFGYSDPHADEHGNISVVVAGREPAGRAALLFADASSPPDAGADCLVTLDGDTARGRGLAEDSIGVAALLALAEHLAGNGTRQDLDCVLLFAAAGSERGDTQPLREFIRGRADGIAWAVNVRSLLLGRIAERPLGACRLRVRARTEERDVAAAGGASSAISALAAIASRLGSIRWDSANSTFLNIARLEAGAGFGWHATDGIMEIEILSTEAATLEVARNAVQATIEMTSEESGADAEVEVTGFYPVAKPGINAVLTETLRRVYTKLRIRPLPVSIPDQAAFFSSLGIPALSIGITTGRRSLTEESVDIPPIQTGFRQLLALLEECARSPTGGGR